MSAMTVSVAQIYRRAQEEDSIERPRSSRSIVPAQPRGGVETTASPADWRLTDRGIAVVMVIAAMILTVALAVIGLTAVRVTSADHGAGMHGSQHDQH